MKSALSLLRVGVDLDGVLNNLGETTLLDLQSRGWAPPAFRFEQVTDYWMDRVIPGVTKEQILEVFEKGDVFWNAKPNLDARTTLEVLMGYGAEVHIVTSRNFSSMHRKLTEEWLRKYAFPYTHLAIYGKEEKADYASAMKLDVFIEDYLGTAVEMCDIVRASILLDQPYNRWIYERSEVGALLGLVQAEPRNLLRAYHWKEIDRYFFERD